MIHIKLFEEHYLDLAQLDLVLVEEAPQYKSFAIYFNLPNLFQTFFVVRVGLEPTTIWTAA